jgi:phage baseplate assembly protein W
VVPNLVAHDASQQDLVIRRRPIVGVLPERAREAFDFGVIGGRQNLAQALLLRLLTPRGSLTALGHADYGSRLHELIGRRKTLELRNLCRAFVLEVVAQEPRVEQKAVELTFDPAAETLSSFVFTLAVKPLSGSEALALSLEVGL